MSNIRFTFDLFNDKAFYLAGGRPQGRVQKFEPDFPPFRVERKDLITDIFQGAMPAFAPVLPNKPVNKGDTWTGERDFLASFFEYGYDGARFPN